MGYGEKDLAINGGSRAKTTENIPMFPGGLEIGDEEKKEVLEVLDAKYLFRYYGPKEAPSKVAKLEAEYERYLGARHCLAVNSCTSALITALVAVGVEPGDEVVVPAYTFFATVAAVVAAKAVPIVAEVDRSLTIDPRDLARKIGPRTKAVIAVHMRGMPAKMDEILELTKKRGISVIEDVAQANGGSYRGRKLGTLGDVGAFSLQFHKIITSGEGGVMSMNDDLLFTRSQAYHDVAACWRKDRFAPPEFDGEIFFGVNFRMSELTGAVALAQLRKLDGLVGRMRRNKSRIMNQIKDLPGIDFRENTDPDGDTAIALIMFLRNEKSVEGFIKALRAEGIEAAGIYNKGVPDWHVYHHWRILLDKKMATKKGCPFNCSLSGPVPNYSEDDCPNTRDWLARSVHLDVPPQMTDQDCDQVAEGIRKVASVLL